MRKCGEVQVRRVGEGPELVPPIFGAVSTSFQPVFGFEKHRRRQSAQVSESSPPNQATPFSAPNGTVAKESSIRCNNCSGKSKARRLLPIDRRNFKCGRASAQPAELSVQVGKKRARGSQGSN